MIHVLNPIFFKEIPSSEFITFFFFNGSEDWVHIPIFWTPWFYLMIAIIYHNLLRMCGHACSPVVITLRHIWVESYSSPARPFCRVSGRDSIRLIMARCAAFGIRFISTCFDFDWEVPPKRDDCRIKHFFIYKPLLNHR